MVEVNVNVEPPTIHIRCCTCGEITSYGYPCTYDEVEAGIEKFREEHVH